MATKKEGKERPTPYRSLKTREVGWGAWGREVTEPTTTPWEVKRVKKRDLSLTYGGRGDCGEKELGRVPIVPKKKNKGDECKHHSDQPYKGRMGKELGLGHHGRKKLLGSKVPRLQTSLTGHTRNMTYQSCGGVVQVVVVHSKKSTEAEVGKSVREHRATDTA